MHRMVNGERVEMTPEEEAAQLAEWQANAAKPRAVPPRSEAEALIEALLKNGVVTRAEIDAEKPRVR